MFGKLTKGAELKSLTRNVGRRERAGTALPLPFTTLTNVGVQIRQSELTLVAGQPGSGKSSLALSVAVHANVPTLYICADTSEQTMRTRTAAMLTGMKMSEAEARMFNDIPWAQSVFDQTQHIAWSFDATPSLFGIEEEILAYEEVHGVTPALLIVDNLIDVAVEGHDEWGGLRKTVQRLKNMSRETESAVLALHHTSEAVNTIGIAPPRSALQGKVGQLPAVILTIDNDPTTDMLGVAVVKNRFGKADARGTLGGYLSFDAARMQIRDTHIPGV